MLVWQPGAPSPTPTKSTTPTPCSSNTTCSVACRPARSCSATRSRCCPAAPRRSRPSSRPSAASQDSINLEYFILADVQSGGVHLSDLLLDRLRAGVKVNMIYDAFGSRDTPRALFRCHAAGRSKGAGVQSDQPASPRRIGWSPNDRDHRKITVVDGRIGFTGGVNLDTAYENPPSAGIPAGRQHAQSLLARYRGANRRPGRGGTAKAVLRHLARAEGARG